MKNKRSTQQIKKGKKSELIITNNIKNYKTKRYCWVVKQDHAVDALEDQ